MSHDRDLGWRGPVSYINEVTRETKTETSVEAQKQQKLHIFRFRITCHRYRSHKNMLLRRRRYDATIPAGHFPHTEINV